MVLRNELGCRYCARIAVQEWPLGSMAAAALLFNEFPSVICVQAGALTAESRFGDLALCN
jgi:hypothetical protein